MPTEKGREGFVFQFMCPGGEVEGVVYNHLSEVLIYHNGTLLKEYTEMCPVDIGEYFEVLSPDPFNFRKLIIILKMLGEMERGGSILQPTHLLWMMILHMV